jgi:hypothetical protein
MFGRDGAWENYHTAGCFEEDVHHSPLQTGGAAKVPILGRGRKFIAGKQLHGDLLEMQHER